MHYDPYDICVAFDDIYERPHVHLLSSCMVGADLQHVTRNVLRRARRKRLIVPLRVEPVVADTTARSFRLDARSCEVLGGTPRAEVLEASGLPLYASFLRCFQTAQPGPKLVRLDTPATYARFRKTRRDRYADFDDRLRILERSVVQHAADRHSDRLLALEHDFKNHLSKHPDDTFDFGDYPAGDVLGAEVERAARQLASGEQSIAVVPKLRGKVECWQDGDEICCTVRFRNRRGNLALATTGTPVQRHLEEALACTGPAEFEHVLPVLHRLAQILGSTTLIPELCRSVSILSTTGETSPMIGVMFAQSTPTLAAAMALLQCCQQGDMLACAEVRAMEARGVGSLLSEAADRLVYAQCAKARTMWGT